MLKDIVMKNRSYRRFYEDRRISEKEIIDCIDTARYTASGANRQSLRYMISTDEKANATIFECLCFAGYYKDWDGPKVGERPSAYIIILGSVNQNTAHDEGIVAQTIMLAATEKGFGGCMIGNIDRTKLEQTIQLPDNYTTKLILALGYPKEDVIIEDIHIGDDIKYYRDANNTHHVPKLVTEDLIIRNRIWLEL